ncbi:uncharacterized protein N7482_008300 [Penicillium canariense]|uniref:Uncharacterized protein n=1 Tax=Penicillium canariense TaxID=189055 RepID=A0A9W9HW07_9EURO|nr:uncharacterized protein N7482_008300 [Penicillium canariense]KAJ5157200.1 hypothetical protein N7482_008300 [Penicillium canariense]
MIDTKIIINAPPAVVRKAFLNFAALPIYHTRFIDSIVSLSQDTQNAFTPGDKIRITLSAGTFTASVEANSPTEFAWCGTLGSNWVFHGTHSFKFLPASETEETTLFVQTEVFGGVLSLLEKVTDGSHMAEKFQSFNEDLKRYVEGGSC